MKKAVFLVLIFVLSLFLSSCIRTGNGTESSEVTDLRELYGLYGTPKSTGPVELSEDEMITIISSHLTSHTHSASLDMSDYSIECFGKENDVYVAFIHVDGIMHTMMMESDTVGGWFFSYGNSLHLSVCTDSGIYSMEDAYQKGILTDSLLDTSHRNYRPNEDNVNITSFELERINYAWNHKIIDGRGYFAETLDDFSPERNIFYGKYRNALVLMRNSPAELCFTETVAGFDFYFPYDCELWVCAGYKYYTLSEAYEAKMLRLEDIEDIHKKHLEWLASAS